MSGPSYVPVIIGVGDVVNRSLTLADAIEPMQLMLEAISQAIKDSEVVSVSKLQEQIDSIDVVACWTWPYDNLPELLAKRLNIQPKHTFMPAFHGGNQPAQLLDEAARRISVGQSELAVVCGGEALASLGVCAKARQLPPHGWTKPTKKVDSVFSPSTRDLAVGLGKPHGIGAPIHVYPLYENGFRAVRHQSIDKNNLESAELYASFAKIAGKQIYSWSYGKQIETRESIDQVSERNRMICFPYPLLMNAFNNVNLAAACILTSTARARELGVPESRWVYPLGGAGTRDSYDFWLRPNYYSSPSISRSLDAALHASGLQKSSIDAYDFYSCFPIVPKLACHQLGLAIESPEKPITLLGGLTSFGGAGNNYSMHALTEMTRQIREGKIKNGLVLANGGCLTYQHAICLSSNQRTDGLAYPSINPLSEFIEDIDVPQIESSPEGEAIIETYTVEFDRHGKSTLGHIVGRLKKNNQRFLANHGDRHTLQLLASTTTEPIGSTGRVKGDTSIPGRNLFYADRKPRL